MEAKMTRKSFNDLNTELNALRAYKGLPPVTLHGTSRQALIIMISLIKYSR